MQPLLVLTIGQSPRPDIEAELVGVLGHRPLEIRGALDGLSREEVEALAPIDDPDTLHTRLIPPDGGAPTDVLVSKKAVAGFLGAQIEEAGGRPTIVACTGNFEGLPARPNVLFPSAVLDGLIDATLPTGHRLGVLVPLVEQVELFSRLRGRPGRPAIVATVKPGDDPTVAATELAEAEVDLVVLDCFGYDSTLLDQVREITGVPVLSSVRATALLAAELLG